MFCQQIHEIEKIGWKTEHYCYNTIVTSRPVVIYTAWHERYDRFYLTFLTSKRAMYVIRYVSYRTDKNWSMSPNFSKRVISGR